MRRRRRITGAMKLITGILLTVWMLVSSLSIALGQVSDSPIISIDGTAIATTALGKYSIDQTVLDSIIKNSSVSAGSLYCYKEPKFRLIQKLEAKADYCDSTAAANDSIIHHQRDKIAIQAAFRHTDSLALASARHTNHELSSALAWSHEKRKQDRTLFGVIGTVLLIIGAIAISK
jgi:hypothetical protein